jgi:hypothetical protein
MKNRIGMGNSISEFKLMDRELDEKSDELLDEINEED